MPGGFSAPFVRLYYNDKELSQELSKASYTYDEEGDDEFTATIQTGDPNIVDRPEYQELARIKVTWGYIGGASVTRIVYWQDIKWVFDKEGITGTLKGAEKAVALKQNSATTIHKNKTLPGIVGDMANKHGLNAYVETESSKPKPVKKNDSKYASLNDYLPLNQGPSEEEKVKIAEKQKEQRERQQRQSDEFVIRNSEGYSRFEKQLNEYYALKKVPPDDFLKRNASYVRIYRSRYKIVNFPQAGKSDFQALKEVAEISSTDPVVLDTRDDDITIRKRNFNQKPYKRYTYMGNAGDLLSFTPETKGKANKSNTINIVAGGWDGEKKQFTSDIANSDTSDTKTVLNDWVPKGGVGFVKDFGKLTGVTPADNTNVRKYMIIKDLDETKNKKFLLGPRGTQETANNRRDAGDIQKNPGTVLMEGDPNIKVGQLITIENVGKKYNGNYYIIKSVHELIPASGYMTTLEIARQGQNVKANDNEKSAKESKKLVNKQMGVDNENIRKKLMKTSNKR